MTILLQSDWEKHPRAIVHTNTRNTSFLAISAQYAEQDIKNHSFMLALHNPDLRDVDPFDPNLTIEQNVAVAIEARDNMWYFLRECARVPGIGHPDSSFVEANRGNIAMWWSFGMRMTVGLQQIRQTWKTTSTHILLAWLLNLGMTNTKGCLTTRDEMMARIHATNVRQIIDELPPYLNLRDHPDFTDAYNVTASALGNDIAVLYPHLAVRRAINQGRGMTFPLLVADDLPYQINGQHSFPTMIAAMCAATQRAHDDNKPYGVIIPTPAGKRDTPEGEFVYQMFSGFAKWTDAFFDCDTLHTLYEIVRNLSPEGRYAVWIEMNHTDLGKSDEWLQARLAESRITGDDAEREYFNKWTGVPYQEPQAK